jgi:Protein of unknown function (DUF3987)
MPHNGKGSPTGDHKSKSTKIDTGAAIAFPFLCQMFDRTRGAVFLASYANNRDETDKFKPFNDVVYLTKPDAADVEIADFIQDNDIPGRACYFAVNVMIGHVRNKTKVDEITCLHVDVDFHGIVENKKKILEVLGRLKIKPSAVVASGHGLHCYWWFDKLQALGHIKNLKEKAKHTDAHEKRLRDLAEMLAADTSAAEVVRVLRLPGSHNTKDDGESLAVSVVEKLSSWKRYSVAELDIWIASVTKPLLTRVEKPKPEPVVENTKPMNFWQRVRQEVKQRGGGFDFDDMLDAMVYKDTEGQGIDDTYTDIIGTMVAAHAPLSDVLATLLGPTRKVYERDRHRYGKGPWDEKLAITEITKKYNRFTANDRKRDEAEARAEKTEAPKTTKSETESDTEEPNAKRRDFDFDFDTDPLEPKSHWIAPHDFWSISATENLRPGMVPPIIENVAFEYAERTGMDASTLAMSMLTCCSAVIPTDIKVAAYKAADEDFIESIRIWQANVGDAGSGKSPIQKVVTKQLGEINKRSLKEYNERKAIFDALSKDDQKNTDKPVRRRVLLPDASVESSQVVYAQNPDGLLASYPELVKYFGDKSRYSNKGGGEQSNRGFELASYDSESFSSTRISRDDVDCVPSKSILGGIQPGVLHDLLEEASRNDGLVQRFNAVIMPEKPNDRVENNNPKYPMTIYDSLIKKIFDEMPLRSAIFHFSPKAEAVRDRMFKWVSEKFDSCISTNPQLAAHLNKFKGMFVRFCGLFHVIEYHTDKHPRLISAETANMVYKFMTSFRYAHAKAFYEMIRENEETSDMKNIAEYILSHDLMTVSAREIQQGAARLRHLDAKAIANTASTMIALGWLKYKTGKRGDSKNWDVNPDVHPIFVARAGIAKANNIDAVRNIQEAKAKAEKQMQKGAK